MQLKRDTTQLESRDEDVLLCLSDIFIFKIFPRHFLLQTFLFFVLPLILKSPADELSVMCPS